MTDERGGTGSAAAPPPSGDRAAPPGVPIGRHPRDLVDLILACGLLAVCAVLARTLAPGPVELGLAEQIQQLPGAAGLAWRLLALVGGWPGAAAAVALLLYLKRIRLSVELAAAVAASWVLAVVMARLVGPRPVPPELREVPGLRLPDVEGFVLPATHVAVAAAMAAVVSPYLAARYRGLVWALVGLVAVADVHLGTALPLDAAAGVLLGWGVAAACHLVWGAPGRRTTEPMVRRALVAAGFAPVELAPVRSRMVGPLEFAVTTEAGERLRVDVVQHLHRRAGPWYRLRRLLASVEVEDEPPLASVRHETEHEALVTVVAERAGLRTPPLVTICETRHAPLLVKREIAGRRLPDLPAAQVDENLLDAVWAQVAVLQDARIAHHDLRARHILVDPGGRPWILGLTFGKIGASTSRTAQDLAEVLVSVASVVGVERAVRSACRALSADRLERALPYLQPLALPRRVRAQLRRERDELTELRDRLAEEIDRPVPILRSPVRPATIAGILLLGAAVYALLPLLSSADEVVAALRDADPGWLLVTTATGALAIVFSAVSFLGSSPAPLPFWRTTAVQLGAAFTGRTTPGGIGFVAINVAFLERLGMRRSSAIGATVLNLAAGGVVGGICCVVGLLGVRVSSTLEGLRIPLGPPVLGIGAGVLVAAVLALFSPVGRRRVLRPGLRMAGELAATLRHPVRATQLFGGALGHMLASGAGLATALAAFGTPVPVFGAFAVFMIGQTLGHLLPVPGGIGPVEALMIAGLVALGVGPTVAVAAVLVSRLLTYWLPVLPGIVAFRYLQHRTVI